jgi:hypothetical protein
LLSPTNKYADPTPQSVGFYLATTVGNGVARDFDQ